MSDRTADIEEIFSSVQGEGLLVGLRQIFLRFHACNLECSYCDTQNGCPEFCAVEATAGRRDFVQVKNPMTPEQVIAVIDTLLKACPGVHHSISLTGGEPLLHYETLLDWLPALRSRLPLYLETNGVLHTALRSLIHFIDYISMDIKIPSTSGHSELWECHLKFLKIAIQKNVYVKSVIGNSTERWEIVKACEVISSVDRNIPFVLQPVTLKNGKVGIEPLKALELQETASAYLSQVRIIPQTHKFVGQL